MGFLNTEEVTVEAVLTSKGREKLANGQSLGITKFALSDDEVDYSLWESSHPAGSEFSGNVISNTPLFEAFTEETQSLRNKLITLPRGTTRLPIVSVSTESVRLQGGGDQATITPTTRNGSNDTLGYTAVIQDSSVATLGVAAGGQVSAQAGTIPNFLSDSDNLRTQTIVARKFLVTAQSVRPGQTKSTTISIVGNETGGSTSIDVTVVGVENS